MYKYNHTELAWAAGLFDGEGYVGWVKNCGMRLSIGQVHRYVLERFMSAVGVGKIVGPYAFKQRIDGYNRKPRYDYVTQTHESIQAIACVLWPHLSAVKREQFRSVLAKAKELYTADKSLKRRYAMQNRTRTLEVAAS